MRVVHISDCYLPRTGGIESQVSGLARAQAAAGHQVSVLTATPAAGTVPASSPDALVHVERLPAPLPGDWPVTTEVGSVLLHRVRALNPDVVHIHAGLVSPVAWPAMVTLARAGLPVVVTVHCLWGPIARASLTGLFAAFDLGPGGSSWRHHVRWTAVSPLAADPVHQVVRDEVSIIPNGVDEPAWSSIRRQLPELPVPAQLAPELPASELKLVSVLRLAPRKRAAAVLRVVAHAQELVGDRARISAVLVGDGPQRAAVERLRHHLGLQQVRLAGRLDTAGVRAELAAADAFISTAHLESFGIAALEARSAGLPVLAMADSGVAGFIEHGVSGLLADNDAGLAGQVARLAVEPSLRARLVAYNSSTPTNCDWPAVVATCEQIYRTTS